MSDRGSSTEIIVDCALVERSENDCTERAVCICTLCKERGHTELRCWQKYPRLKPVQKSLVSKTKPD